jgi:hypothetical protein
MLLQILVLPPLLIPFCVRGSFRDRLNKPAIQAFDDVVPRKYRCVVTIVYFALLLFAFGEMEGWF